MFGKDKKIEDKATKKLYGKKTIKREVGKEVAERMKFEEQKTFSKAKTKLAKEEGKKIKVVENSKSTKKSILKNAKNQHSSEFKESGKFSRARDAKRFSGVHTRGVDMQEAIKNHPENKQTTKKGVKFNI